MALLEDKSGFIASVMEAGPVIPVVVIRELEAAVPLARALLAGGISVIEVTLRTSVALDAIRAIAVEVEGIVPGAGTVLDAGQLEAANAAGAKFAVSPGATAALLDAAQGHPLPLLPGAATASEAMALIERGICHQKFFPAGASGGAKYLASLVSPLPMAKFCPTGGVTPANARDYLALANVLCVGGSWITPSDAIAAGDWNGIEALARQAAGLG
ncbi:MAG: bifunctional 4-hydroxy-2-oxoglutarate aldolase/2-dehydro-3-deoxy-phosphogluconate aldolase, partial [Rhizobiales bacterium]|nr:bifunctional 4-hydroxy-2-oxoglutarate aldolase/2-dehydro-3-deoxy-phosphogluconate aldolase [Hyphomicrobiales bacterium]